jgi:hypothetical protein
VVAAHSAVAAFVAVTLHDPPTGPLKSMPFTLQSVPVTAKVTAPVPDPPDVVKVIGLPVIPVVVVFDTVSTSWTLEKLKVLDPLIASR